MLLVSGDLARRTGGNLYDRRMERACRRAGVSLRMIAIGSTAQARSVLARLRPSVIVIDSIAIPIAAPLVSWMRAELRARVIALMHMPTAARGTHAILRAADRVIAVSPDLARTLSRAGVSRSRLTVIPPGSDGIPRVSRRAREARDGGRLRVLAVANWSPAKGIATLVAAAAHVPDIHVDLVGDVGSGAYRDSVLARIRSNGLGARVVVHGGRLRVLAVANWSPAKGIATLVAAAAQVPDIHLDLVGDVGSGTYHDMVLTRIRSNGLGSRVVVHGALGARALARRYAEADVFALPTEREGYGIVFAEALAHGLPIVAADIASVRAIVGEAGLFVPPRRVRPLAAALRLVTDSWLRRRLSKAARVRARGLPSWATGEAAFVALVRHEMRAAVARS